MLGSGGPALVLKSSGDEMLGSGGVRHESHPVCLVGYDKQRNSQFSLHFSRN
tara:strand:- start:1035 stop:1190 length:156 start_codon:yes stop_codon:yes gene_type:complete